MIVSLIPTFKCLNKCGYCYLGNLRLTNNILSLDKLRELLNDLTDVTQIDIFGGDISLLTHSYLKDLYEICKTKTDNISCTTNKITDYIHSIFKNISISVNIERKDFKVNYNLFSKKIDYSMSIVATSKMVDFCMSNKSLFLSYAANAKYVYIMKYSKSVNNTKEYGTDKDYVKLIQFIIEHGDNINLINNDELNNLYDPTLNSNIFILPSGKYGYIKFEKDNEYFCEFDSLDEYDDIKNNERKLFIMKCGTCKYFNRCYTEHLNLTNNKCNGYIDLIEWYDKRNNTRE